MTSMRTVIGLAAAIGLAVTAPAHAQMQGQLQKIAQTTPEQRAKLQTAAMQEKLSLTPQQAPAVAKINLDTATQMQPVLEGTDGPLVRMRKAQEIEAGRDAALQKVLEPPQYQQWLAQKEAIKQQVEQRLMESRAGGG